MGCDAHPIFEVKTNGRWGFVDSKSAFFERFYSEHDGWNRDAYNNRPPLIRVFGDRSYRLFATLADVRNHDGITPLFPDRGLPDDCSPEAQREIGDAGLDLHSHTHFTLRELVDTNWDAIGQEDTEIVLFADQYLTYMGTGELPDDANDWAPIHKDTGEVSKEEMIILLMANDPKNLVRRSKGDRVGPYVKVRLPVPYRLIVPELIQTGIPELLKLGKPDEVRVLIAFDN